MPLGAFLTQSILSTDVAQWRLRVTSMRSGEGCLWGEWGSPVDWKLGKYQKESELRDLMFPGAQAHARASVGAWGWVNLRPHVIPEIVIRGLLYAWDMYEAKHTL